MFYSLLMFASDTMKSFFEPRIDKIVDLIEGQLGQVELQQQIRCRVRSHHTKKIPFHLADLCSRMFS